MTASSAVSPDAETGRRQRWIKVLAKAPVEALEEAWRALPDKPTYVLLRKPEIGLAMVRARAGGTGTRFNLGEMTMTRCALRLASGRVGFGYVAGRELRKVELAALFDALLQDPARRDELEASLVDPLEAAQRATRRAAATKAAATRVEFFTMVRGEDMV